MASYYNTIIKPFILVLLLLIQISFSSSSSRGHLCLTEQHDALLQLKKTFAVNPHYGCGVSWQNDTDCCMWERVTCDNKTGDVIELDLHNCGLQGIIDNNSSLVSLPNLQSLDLSWNQLNGSLSSFPQLLKLLHLDLSDCELQGTIDNISSLIFLQNLQSLDLSLNQLNGSLSSFPQLPKLLHLDLSYNYFSDIITHEIAHLSQLISLNLKGNNDLTIASSTIDLLIQNLTNIQELCLDQVRIDGVLASSLLNPPTSLTYLSLYNCSLIGRFPDYIFHLPNLYLLDVSQNLGLTGTLPSLNWSSPLSYLYLSSTGFSGNIPTSICSLSSLEKLDLSSNIFLGLIPHCLGNLTNLQQLDLSSNQLTRPLPRSLSNCTLLQFMNASSNMLSDVFPSWLSHLPNLKEVYLGRNRFYGPIDRLINGSSLSMLDLSQNSFSGHLLEFDGNSPLYSLDLSSNSLDGPILKLPQVSHSLSLSNNNFTRDSLSLCESFIYVLDLSNNSLAGTIPPCLLNYSDVISLEMNKFEGAIPNVFVENSTIIALFLGNNQLTGPLPHSMVNCKMLKFLDLSHNNIEDFFPSWLEALPDLQILLLQSNRLNGGLKTPRDHSFPKLKLFDISNNNLTGLLPIRYFNGLDEMIIDPKRIYPNLPPEVTSVYKRAGGDSSIISCPFKIMLVMKGSTFEIPKVYWALKLIDFSNNNFQGEIPDIIGKLRGLKGLNLSHNNLTGSIPRSIQNLTHLEWLDLSSNQLSGVIPRELTDLTELSILNFSYNELSGMIPSGKQFDTFEKESFVGNIGLCGKQVKKSCGELNISKPPQLPLPPTERDDFEAFDWRIIFMGYGCGLIIGISIGYMVLELRRPVWFVLLVEEKLLMKIARSSRLKN